MSKRKLTRFQRERQAWRDMLNRCYNPNAKEFCRYGARGIQVCDHWRNSFESFLADVGLRPPGTSLDRIKNDRGYEPDNCKWRAPKEQGRNRRDNRLLTFNGETLCIAEWSERIGVKYVTIQNRLDRGLPIEKVLSSECLSARGYADNLLEFNGERLSLAAWGKRLGMTRNSIIERLRRGWSVADAVTIPHTRRPANDG